MIRSLVEAALLVLLTAPLTSCSEKCPTADDLLLASDANTFSFAATGGSDVVEAFPSGGDCVLLGGDPNVSVNLYATQHRADDGLLLAYLDSEQLGTVVAEPEVVTFSLRDERNLLVCQLGDSSCAFVAPGVERKVAATLSVTTATSLHVVSDGSVVPDTSIAKLPFANACADAARRDCAPPTVTLEECASVASFQEGCPFDRSGEIAAAFLCEAACDPGCSDSCGVLDGVR